MGNAGADPDRERFYKEFIALLHDLKPGLIETDPEPETHLWNEYYLDSIGLLEVIYFLEDRSGQEITLAGDFLPRFFTMQRIYEEFARPTTSEA